MSYEYPNLQTQISTMTGWRRAHGYGPPSVREALGVPSILRCVTLIQRTRRPAHRRGLAQWRSPMAESPRIISRPDPDRTPRDFYAPSGLEHGDRTAKSCGASCQRDGDGLAPRLSVVPLRELTVEREPR